MLTENPLKQDGVQLLVKAGTKPPDLSGVGVADGTGS